MDAVSVIIATCDRPGFLYEALDSVRRQTACERIGQVIVSENSLNDDSAAICAGFPELPILYLKQRPPVPMVAHLKVMWPRVSHPLVAFLHDDDWWAPEHLQHALDVLDTNAGCTATFSNHFWTESSRCPARVSDAWAWQIWAATGCDFSKQVVELDAHNLIAAALWATAFHYSTMVGRAQAVWAAHLENLNTGNVYDNDRTFPVFLSAHGRIGFVTQPDAYVRLHENQDSFRYRDSHEERHSETTRWIRRRWPDEFAAAIQLVNTTAAALDPATRQRVTMFMSEPQKNMLVTECGLLIPETAAQLSSDASTHSVSPAPRHSNSRLRKICPPAIFALYDRLRQRVKSVRSR